MTSRLILGLFAPRKDSCAALSNPTDRAPGLTAENRSLKACGFAALW
jgi:hypothetical protein